MQASIVNGLPSFFWGGVIEFYLKDQIGFGKILELEN